MKKVLFLLLFTHCALFGFSQDASTLISQVKAKLDKVNDYTATGILKTDVAFIKAPLSKVKLYFKKPNQFKLKKEGGISILPKGGISINMANIVNMKDFAALDAGTAVIDGINTKIVKLIPASDTSDIVLSTLYIDEQNLVLKKSVTTTRENGTYEINLSYGKYINYGLPDKVIFMFNAKDYKLPKGVTMEFNDEGPAELQKLRNKKGKVEIDYSSYIINKGVDEAVFK